MVNVHPARLTMKINHHTLVSTLSCMYKADPPYCPDPSVSSLLHFVVYAKDPLSCFPRLLGHGIFCSCSVKHMLPLHLLRESYDTKWYTAVALICSFMTLFWRSWSPLTFCLVTSIFSHTQALWPRAQGPGLRS